MRDNKRNVRIDVRILLLSKHLKEVAQKGKSFLLVLYFANILRPENDNLTKGLCYRSQIQMPFQIVNNLLIIYQKVLQNFLRLGSDKTFKNPHEIACKNRV